MPTFFALALVLISVALLLQGCMKANTSTCKDGIFECKGDTEWCRQKELACKKIKFSCEGGKFTCKGDKELCSKEQQRCKASAPNASAVNDRPVHFGGRGGRPVAAQNTSNSTAATGAASLEQKDVKATVTETNTSTGDITSQLEEINESKAEALAQVSAAVSLKDHKVEKSDKKMKDGKSDLQILSVNPKGYFVKKRGYRQHHAELPEGK
eukprot:TRINITY_DN2497_c2_g1_i1.p1 TRINITY_DN2497_c2_g1~~TRINITY_DN2497_c2_g1_i1.p1  ORF type:complete len:211 (-),score=60.20 TRINITY_DN2497_c2_g1_i1:86-718(-)